MSLIYPREAFLRFGPPPLVVRDARGRQLHNIVACDPLTGEVIDLVVERALVAFGGYVLPTGHSWLGLILARLWTRLGVNLLHGELARRHWFAPAPLTINGLES